MTTHLPAKDIKYIVKIIVALFFLLVLMWTYSEESLAARVVAEKRECATCHIAWISEFKRDDITTLIPYEPWPLEESGRQDVVSTERMCFSCHDGFVLDSRFLWQGGHNHPIGVKPSDKVVIPKEDGIEIFPLNEAGNIYCGTCHSAHGVEWGDKTSPFFLRTKNIESSLCLMCHIDREGDVDGKFNHPIGERIENLNNDLLKAEMKTGKEDSVICQSCHNIHGAAEKKLLISKNESSQLCKTCHLDKNTKSTTNKEQKFSHPVNRVSNKISVPKSFVEVGSQQGPKGEVLCETCHKIHQAPSNKLIVLNQDRLKNGLCVLCHVEKESLMKGGHNLFNSRKREMDNVKNQPFLGVCAACHNVHNGSGPMMWARNVSKKGDPMAELCLSCHKEGQLANEHTVGDNSHPVGVILSEDVEISEDLPLFTKTGMKTFSDKKGRVSCATCHDVHSSPYSGGEKRLFGRSDSDNFKYLRKGEANRQLLCKECHSEKWSIEGTKHDLDEFKPEEHGLGVCGNCHLVHNGKGARMWSRESNTDLDTSKSLCLSCHSKGEQAKEKLIGEHSHPVDVSIENVGISVNNETWMWGIGKEKKRILQNLPLYGKGTKNHKDSTLLGCGTCHDPHRWDNDAKGSDKKTDKQDEGDSSNSFLRVAASPDGQLCIICHATKSTVRATDHDMAVTAKEAKNIIKETPEQSGVCGQCHAVHNAKQDLALWARNPGQGRDAMEKLCRSCHAEGEIAQEKNPKHGHHPNYVRAWSGELRQSLHKGAGNVPMYSNSGRVDDIGFITCPTCHNVHQWSAGNSNKGSGMNEEGDVLSSFLRLPTTEGFICADCHGLDSLFRYKYFHGSARNFPK